MNDLTEALRDARDQSNRDEYVRRVKEAVHKELLLLDADADIEDTHYFNHSAIPDFVIKWSSETKRRDVYLRGSYAAIVASHDVEELDDRSPVLFALDPQNEFHEPGLDLTPETLSRQTAETSETLLTDPAALGRITGAAEAAENPLGPLVRANFLRGGRGLIDESRAETLVSAGQGTSTQGVTDLIRGSFTPDAVLRLERTAALIEMAVNTSLASTEGTEEAERTPLTGHLSAAEAAALLPWLLEQDNITTDTQYWRSLGSLLDLATLELVATSIGQRDITRLIVPNAADWLARRAYLGLAVAEDQGPQPSDGRWRFRGTLLTFELGDHRVTFATNGRQLPGRDGGRVPRWERLGPVVRDQNLTCVQLTGLNRSVTITAEESEDVTADADGVSSSLQEDFSAPEISLRLRSANTESQPQDVDLRFRKSLAVAEGGVSIADLTRLALTVLAYETPVSPETLEMHLSPESSAIQASDVPGAGTDA